MEIIKAKELFLKGEIEDDDFNVIISDCKAQINSMGKNFQQLALYIMQTRNDINKTASQLLHMDRLFLEVPVKKKIRVIRLILKDKIIPSDQTFKIL